jgi:hypothetical protein
MFRRNIFRKVHKYTIEYTIEKSVERRQRVKVIKAVSLGY